MHDVQLHFGDLQKSWGRHKPEAVGLLFNLLCAYYDREKPLPDDFDFIADLAGATTDSQRTQLERLLKRHLQRVQVGAEFVWKWPRCDIEIARYQHRCKVNAYNNLKKFVGNSGGKLFLPSFADFSAHTDHFRDPVLNHFRNLEKPFRVAPAPVPKVSDSENVGLPKSPTSGDHSPTLPLSQIPTLPKSSAGAVASPKPCDPKALALAIYMLYPRKIGRTQALKAIEKVLKSGDITEMELQTKVRLYAESVKDADPQFIPYPATWFNGGRHLDDPAEWKRTENARSAPVFDGKKKKGGAPSVDEAFPLLAPQLAAVPSAGAPDGYRRAWEALIGAMPCPAWAAIDDATQGAIRQWLDDEKAQGGGQ